MDHDAMSTVKFFRDEAYHLENMTYLFERRDTVKQCMDMITSNRTDLTGSSVSIKTSIPRAKFFAVIDASPHFILSAYDRTRSTLGTSVLSSFRAWSPAVILVIMFLIFSVFVLFTLHSNVYRRYKESMAKLMHGQTWIQNTIIRKPVSFAHSILCLVLHQPSSCPSITGVSRKSASFKVTHITLLVLMFMISFYFVSFVQTDLVTVDEVSIIESYAQILADPKLKVMWNPTDAVNELFQKAETRSIRHQLWQRSPNLMINVKDRSFNGMDLISRLNNSEIVLIGKELSIKTSRRFLCMISGGDAAGFRPLITKRARDDEGDEIMSSMYNDRLPHDVVKLLAARMLLLSQSGIISKLHDIVMQADFLMTGESNQSGMCSRDMSEKDAPQVKQKVMKDYETLFQRFLLLCAATIVPLAWEVVKFRKEKRA
jgi:hypothetical protein